MLTHYDGFSADALAVLIQPDGKIVAAGSAKNPTSYYDFALARYLPDGTLDSSFSQGGRVRTDFGVQNLDQARAAVLQPDGRIVAAGFASLAFGDTRYAAARYNAFNWLTSDEHQGQSLEAAAAYFRNEYETMFRENLKEIEPVYRGGMTGKPQ